MDRMPTEPMSELARARAAVPGDMPSRASMELMKRGRAVDDDRRLSEFLRIERGREA